MMSISVVIARPVGDRTPDVVRPDEVDLQACALRRDEPAADGFGAVVGNAVTDHDTLVPWEPEQPGAGIARGRMGRDRADLHQPESEGVQHRHGTAVLVEPRGQAQRVGQVEPTGTDPQGGMLDCAGVPHPPAQRRGPPPERAGPEGQMVRMFGVEAEEQRPDERLVEALAHRGPSPSVPSRRRRRAARAAPGATLGRMCVSIEIVPV